MNAVGIDISKCKSMVAILRLGGELVARPFEVPHLSSHIQALIEYIKGLDGDSWIVMECTGRYYAPGP